MNKKLIELKEQAKEKLTFFYPKKYGVKGFLGNKDVCFIMSRPSMNKFPSPKDTQFYRLLKKYDLEESHLTDIMKTRCKAGFKIFHQKCNIFQDIAFQIFSIPEDELVLNLKILKRELEILKLKGLKLIIPVSAVDSATQTCYHRDM